MSARRPKAKLWLTERALRDIAAIEAYSIEQWGNATAARYLADIEAALARVQETPALLHGEKELHSDLRFHRVNKHLLVCDVRPRAITLLTVVHASRDIPNMLVEMEPSLAAEIELLHRKLRQTGKR